MSSPLRSLNNGKKLGGKRSMPFRSMDFSVEKQLFSALSPENSNSSRQISTSREERNKISSIPLADKSLSTSPTDADLRLSMIKRIAQLEKQVLVYSREVIDKTKRIKVLEEKLELYQKHQKHSKDDVRDLQIKCESYQLQIEEMEKFLADYGLVWVGEDDTQDANSLDNGEENEDSRHFIINFDLIIKNIEELNALAGEGRHQIHKTADGARLKLQDAIPLTLYANGILMFEGPFRDFTEPTTQRCLADIIDGFFPSELQERYPDGVPIQVTDNRFTTYMDPRRVSARFPGVGRILGRSTSASSVKSLRKSAEGKRNVASNHSNVRTLNDMNKPQRQPTEEFLNKLPNSVLKEGKIIDVRNDIKQLLCDDSGDSKNKSSALTKTSSSSSQQQTGGGSSSLYRNSSPPLEGAADEKLTTIRVKDEDRHFDIKLKYQDTIGDLRKAVDRTRKSKSFRYEIVTNFPKRKFDDINKTLEACELIPNAVVILKPS